jgi:osmoprotectant transport system substrate-binding protein
VSFRRRYAIVAAVGAVAMVVSGLAARGGSVGSAERSLFLFVNGWPDVLYGPMFVFQQGGNLIIVIVVVAALAALLRSWRVLVGGWAAVAAKLVLERVVKQVVERERPGTTIGAEAILRGRVSAHGLSFVSGHVVLTVALAVVLGPHLPRRWRLVPWAVVVLNAVARVYVGAHNPLDVVGGAGLGLLIGGLVNLVVTPASPPAPSAPPVPDGPRRRRRHVAGSAVSLFVLVAACSSSSSPDALPPSDALHDDAITVASFDFPESELLAELYSQSLERQGLRVERAFGLGSREEVAPALVAGLVEVLPEYAGTALQFHSLGRVAGSADPAATHAALEDVLDERGLTALAAAPAQDVNRFVVTRERAARAPVGALSALAATSGQLRFGGPPECPDRPLCLPGLRDRYGVTFSSFVRLDAGGVLTRQALTDGHVDVALLFSTDPSLTTGEFVELADDRGLQPAESITPVVHREVVERFGAAGAVRALDAVSAVLTTEDVRAMNAALRAPGATVPSVVRAWREAKGLA